MKIQPLSNEVQIEVNEAKAGVLSMESMVTAVEIGKVIAIGSDVKSVKVGDEIVFKAWACDIVTVEGKRYYFINLATGGIKGIVK